jgi:hypothetical protein
MKRILIAAALIAVAPITQAACGLNVHVAAWHNEPGFESVTPGIGVVCDTKWTDVRAAGGVFRNSIGRTSVYVGGSWQPLHLGPVRAGVFGGVITGYPRAAVMPMAAGLVSVRVAPRVDAHITVLPTVKGTTPLTVAVSVEYKF